MQDLQRSNSPGDILDTMPVPINNEDRITGKEGAVMFVWRVFTWTLKLILKILLLPVVLVVAALSIFAKIAYYLGAAALGLGMLVLFAWV